MDTPLTNTYHRWIHTYNIDTCTYTDVHIQTQAHRHCPGRHMCRYRYLNIYRQTHIQIQSCIQNTEALRRVDTVDMPMYGRGHTHILTEKWVLSCTLDV